MRVYKKEHPDGRLELLVFLEVSERRPLAQGLALIRIQYLDNRTVREKLRATREFILSLIAAIS